MQKNATEKMRKMIGTRSQPMARRVVRKAISMGNVTPRSVIMTRRVLGGGADGSLGKLSVDPSGK
jgi:hypothetical protein